VLVPHTNQENRPVKNYLFLRSDHNHSTKSDAKNADGVFIGWAQIRWLETFTKKIGAVVQLPAFSSPVPQICVVASNVVRLSKVTDKITKGHWTLVSRLAGNFVDVR
jgi:hypothetical protein